MKKALKRLLAIVMVVVMLLLEAPLGVASQLSALKNMGNLSLMAHASSYMNHNVSYNPVTNNYDSGGFPSGLNYCYENETIYFNFSVGTDVFVRKATYHLSRNGKANYLTGDYTPERDYFRYCNFELSLPDGSYSIYWDVQYSTPNYNDPVGSYSTDSYTFTVYDPEIIPSKNTVNLNIDGTKTATIYMTCHGGGSGNYINFTSSTSYCTVSSGNWNNDRMSFTITATAVGSSTLNFNLRTSGGTTVATTSVTVNVTENTYTLSYDANGGSGAPGNQTGAKSYTISSTVPTYFGKTFLGWSKSSSATSASYVPKDTISLTANTPLYAVWKSAESLSLGTNKSVTISFAKQERYYTFKPSTSGTYSFESTGSLDTKAVLYSSSGSELKSDDDGSENGNNFKLDYSLSSGTTYYLKVAAYQSNTGTSSIAVKYIDSTAPTGSITNATNNVAASQTVTLSMSDNTGVAGYYWGTSSTYTNNTFTSTSASSATKTVSSPGTYYLTVKDTSGNVSTNYSITFYKTTLNPNNGSVSPTSVLTKSGNTFTFPTPTKSGNTYVGWSTSSSATSGVTTLKPTSNSTYYAVWTPKPNTYNLGEETYSFENVTSCNCSSNGGGHCFGMSSTSSGYYINKLDVTKLGISSASQLYSVPESNKVKRNICYYQNMQEYREPATVAGGSWYFTRNNNLASDWNQVVNYVKNHTHDGKGDLQIGFRGIQTKWWGEQVPGGHAVNFLRYEVVNGQERIYAYDNNYPTRETYFYMSNGKVNQAPLNTFDTNAISCIALRDMNTFFSLAGGHDSTRFIYGFENEIKVEGAKVYPMETDMNNSTHTGEFVMFEIGNNVKKVTVTPLVENAEFSYCSQSYEFGEIDSDTSGILTLIPSEDYNENAGISEDPVVTNFVIINEPIEKQPAIVIKNYVPSRTEDYKATITFTAIDTDAPSGASIHWFLNDSICGVGETFTVSEAKSDYVIQAKLVGSNGDLLAMSEKETVKIKTGFFARLKAFFRALFGRLPKVVQEYLGIEIIDRLDP